MRRRLVVGLAAGLVLALGIDGSATSDAPRTSDTVRLIGAVRLNSDDPLFGGFSAISVGPDGSTLIAISDRGTFVQGSILRDADGAVASVRLGPVTLLHPARESGYGGRQSDTEGIAVAPDGAIYISFENKTRVARFARLDAVGVDLPPNKAFAQFPHNQTLEAVAVDGQGTVYTMPEALVGDTIPVYRFQDGAWRTPLSLPRIGTFRPVSAEFGPDGLFYLLERRFVALGGFESRLRRFTLDATGFSDGETLLQTPVGRHDNLEGLSVWQAPDGLRATMVSDDNFFILQTTEIVEYRLPD